MKPKVARISLIVAGVLFFTGFLVLGYCPGWYAVAAGFAAVAAWIGVQGVRFWGLAGLVASLVLTGLHTVGKVREHRRILEAKLRWTERQATNLNQGLKTNGGFLILQTNFK